MSDKELAAESESPIGVLSHVERSPRRLFAIGDIHACPDELNALLSFLEREEGFSSEDLLIFIGDYIDRGPDSKGVIDSLLSFRERFPDTLFLRGNHEDMLLSYLGRGGSQGGAYMFNGGVQFLRSYGLSSVESPESNAQLLPEAHLNFFLSLKDYVQVGDYIFAHAGVNPGAELLSQTRRDLFWIRDEFINSHHPFEKTVVFGHTPYQNLMFHLPYKLGIDTGLVYGNMLSCVDVTSNRALQVHRHRKEVRETIFVDPNEMESELDTVSEE